MIEIKNINKSFNGKEVLKDISAKFEKGKTNLIIGASGTGKSVLLKCMVGIIKPDSGDVIFEGDSFTFGTHDIRKRIRTEMGMLFQGSALFDSMTVEENVMFPLDMLTKKSRAEKLERVNFCLKRVGLENVNDRMPSQISGGMQKRVGIARAIVLNPKFLFCDEPNSGLDPQTAIMIDELIQEITHEFDITTVVVSHDMNSVMKIGDYIIFLHKGQKLWEGSNKTLMQSDVTEFNDFVFATEIMRALKEKTT